MKNEQIKTLIKEAIEEDRKERSKKVRMVISDSFLIGSIGGLLFIVLTAIIIQIIQTHPQATFLAAFVFEAVTIIDMLFIHHLVRWNYQLNQEIEKLKQVN